MWNNFWFFRWVRKGRNKTMCQWYYLPIVFFFFRCRLVSILCVLFLFLHLIQLFKCLSSAKSKTFGIYWILQQHRQNALSDDGRWLHALSTQIIEYSSNIFAPTKNDSTASTAVWHSKIHHFCRIRKGIVLLANVFFVISLSFRAETAESNVK